MAITNGVIQSVLDYYGSASSIYRKIVLGTATDSEISYAFTQIPRMQAEVSAAGTVLGYSYADPVYITPAAGSGIADSVNSNTLGGQYGDSFNARVPISFGRDTQTGQAYITGAQKAGQILASIVDRVSLGVTGVNIGAKLGKAIDQTLYDLDPAWWDEHYPSINPDTWPSLVGESETGQKFFRTLFGIENNGNVTGYVDEKILAQTYQMLRDAGAFNTGDKNIIVNDPKDPKSNATMSNVPRPINNISFISKGNNEPEIALHYGDFGTAEVVFCFKESGNDMAWVAFSHNPFTYTGTLNSNVNNPSTGNAIQTYYVSGKPFYYYRIVTYNNNYNPRPITVIEGYNDFSLSECMSNNSGTVDKVGHIIMYQSDIKEVPSTPGISPLTGATQYPPTNITGTTLDDVLQQLKQTYPDLFNDSITETVLQPDGTTIINNYVPIPWVTETPENVTQTAPVTRTDAQQTDYIIDQTTASEIIADPQTETQPQPQPDDGTGEPPPTYPDTGDGSTPPIIPPVGHASSLWAVYNPTQAEVNAFGGWLWSPDFIDNILKLFNDPMQAIIGIHKVYATPATGGTQPIKCGFLTSNVNSKIVTSQYTTVDCGSVSLPEFFGNVLDYSPHTKIRLFLPFIGFVNLDVGEVMRSTVSVKYTVDVITGACLADVTVTRDGGGGSLYSYGGSCIVTYPVSAGSYSGVISAIAGAALSIMSGNPAGVVRSALGAHTTVQHSGGFTGSAGAMGIKTPYIVIDRPQSNIAKNFPSLDGYGSNYSCKVGDLNGVVRCKEVHVECSRAYSEELKEIEDLLKSGVIV